MGSEMCIRDRKLIAFNLDGILEVYLSIEEREKTILNNSLKMIVENLDVEVKRKLLLLIPNGIKKELKI